MTQGPNSAPLSGMMPASNRTSDVMTVDDLWRARAIAQVLNEPGMIAKIDKELAVIYATHQAIKAAMQGGGTANPPDG